MNNLENTSGTRCLMHCALAAGTTTTLTTTGTTHYSIKGKTYTKAAMTNAANVTTDANTGAAFVALAANKGSVYVVGLDSGGNVKVAQGTIVDLDPVGAFVIAPQFPPIPDTMCPIGYVTLANGPTGSAWTWGSSNWTATGAVDLFVSVSELPPRPQIA